MTRPRSTSGWLTALRRRRARGRPVGRPSRGPLGAPRPGETHLPRRRAGRPWRLRLFLLASAVLAVAWDMGALVRRARRGPWRVEVAGESMIPALHPGDWLLVDPTPAGWPRRGSLVVVREPESDLVVVKRLFGRPGDRIALADGPAIVLGPTEAWLASDGRGAAIDSRRYGPVDVERMLGRVAWRYGPRRRSGGLH